MGPAGRGPAEDEQNYFMKQQFVNVKSIVFIGLFECVKSDEEKELLPNSIGNHYKFNIFTCYVLVGFISHISFKQNH